MQGNNQGVLLIKHFGYNGKVISKKDIRISKSPVISWNLSHVLNKYLVIANFVFFLLSFRLPHKLDLLHER